MARILDHNQESAQSNPNYRLRSTAVALGVLAGAATLFIPDVQETVPSTVSSIVEGLDGVSCEGDITTVTAQPGDTYFEIAQEYGNPGTTLETKYEMGKTYDFSIPLQPGQDVVVPFCE